MTPAAIREASLPKGLRGFDETATRKFLFDVAETVQTLVDQRDKLQRSLDEMNEQPPVDPMDPTAIGNIVLAAQRAGEEASSRTHARPREPDHRGSPGGERADLEETRRSAAAAEQKLEERRDAYELEHTRVRDELDESRRNLEAERRGVIDEARAEADQDHRAEPRASRRASARRAGSERIHRRIGTASSPPCCNRHSIGLAPKNSRRAGETQPELTTVLRSRVADVLPGEPNAGNRSTPRRSN